MNTASSSPPPKPSWQGWQTSLFILVVSVAVSSLVGYGFYQKTQEPELTLWVGLLVFLAQCFMVMLTSSIWDKRLELKLRDTLIAKPPSNEGAAKASPLEETTTPDQPKEKETSAAKPVQAPPKAEETTASQAAKVVPKHREKTVAEDLVYKRIKDEHPTYSQVKVATTAADELGHSVEAYDIQNAYERNSWEWKKANSIGK